MVQTTTSTTLDSQLLDDIKSKGYKVNQLILLGFEAMQGKNHWQERVTEKEQENQAIQAKLKKIAMQNLEMTAKLEEMSQEMEKLQGKVDILQKIGAK